MTGLNRRPYGCKPYALPAELIVHKFVDSTPSLPVLTYPQRLDTAISVGLRCRSYQPHQGRTSPRFHLRIYPSPAHIKNRTLAVRPIVWEWYVGNCKTSYRCRLYVTSPSYQASSFATGRGSPYYLRCRPTSARITKAHRPLSLFSAVRDIHSYPQARYSTTRLISLPNSRLKHCRDLIFFRILFIQPIHPALRALSATVSL